jgi:hypothetical protein
MKNLPRTLISAQQTSCNGKDESCTFCSVQLLFYLDLDALTAISMRAVETLESQMESQMFL